MHKFDNIGVIGNFVFPCSFLFYLQYMIFRKSEIRLQTSLVLLLSDATTKTKLTILSFLYFGEFMKNSCGKGEFEEGMYKRYELSY